MSDKIAIGFLCILYVVGFICIGLGLMPEVVMLTPINLLLSILVALLFDKHSWSKVFPFIIIVFVLGYGLEVAGVQTGAIFGEYAYGAILGPKIWETPLMIGVNWVLLCYAAGYTVNAMVPKVNGLIKAALGSTLLVGLDFLIEPIAIKWDMWTWAAVDIPLQNYIAWWCIAMIMMLLFYKSFKNSKNNVAMSVFILQIAFFGFLNLV